MYNLIIIKIQIKSGLEFFIHATMFINIIKVIFLLTAENNVLFI